MQSPSNTNKEKETADIGLNSNRKKNSEKKKETVFLCNSIFSFASFCKKEN